MSARDVDFDPWDEPIPEAPRAAWEAPDVPDDDESEEEYARSMWDPREGWITAHG